MANQERMTRESLAQKVRWEGGVMAALEYGIESDEIDDPQLRLLWSRLQRLYGELSPLVRELTSTLGVSA